MKTFFPALAALLLLLASRPDAAAEPELKAWLGSAFTIPGEETSLFLWVHSETRPDGNPQAPRAENVAVRFKDDRTVPRRTREKIYLYEFSVRSYAEGTHTIPPMELSVEGTTLRSQPLDLHVSAPPDPFWETAQLMGQQYRYASAVFVPERVPYEGETFPAEVKVYLPEHLSIADASIAEMDHDGVVAWRFEASAAPFPEWPYRTRIVESRVRIDGLDYIGLSYRSTVTAIRTGPIALGPGQARVSLNVQVSRRGTFLRDTVNTQLPVTKRDFLARPLPSNPPPGFKNAVGRFTLTAQAETSGLQEGDPITVRLTVAGLGNLDTLAPPALVASESEWKVYPHSRLARQGERRDVSGMTTISQIIRPMGSERVIPPFRLVFFNPQEERYETISTPPIPFEMTATASRPSSAPLAVLPDLSTPVEEMEGILGLIDPAAPHDSTSPWFWLRYWQLLPALIGLALLARIGKRRVLPRLRRSSREQGVKRALEDLENSSPDGRTFLRAVGTFIERWIPPPNRDEEIESILQRRDTECYRPDSSERQLAPEERRSIIAHLRTRAHATLALLVMILTMVVVQEEASAATAIDSDALYQQAEAAWSEGSYRAAIEFYRNAHPGEPLPADVTYNIGNCHFQLGDRGLAALYYHRTLALEPNHPEARQNLRFLKRKTGAITIVRPKHQDYLGRYQRSLFSTLLAAGLWATGLGLLGIWATLSRPLHLLVWSALGLGPLVALVGVVCLNYYPDDLEFASLSQLGVVVSADPIEARTEASNTSASVISVPPGSLCRPLARRGPWTYVELANQTRGWLPSPQVQMVVPDPQTPSSTSPDLSA